MKKTLLAAAIFSAAPVAQAAPLVDIYAGGYLWQPEVTGTIAAGGDNIDVHDQLGLDDAEQSVLFVGVEHAVPLIPNVRLRYSDLDDSATASLGGPITFAGQTFTGGVRGSYDLKVLDGTLYWSPLNNWIHLDLGVTVRQLDGEFTVRGGGQQASADFTEAFPMAYVGAELEVPGTGLYVGGEANATDYEGSDLSDYDLYLGLRTDFLLGVELGYRRMTLDLDDISGFDSSLEAGGPYLAATLSF